MASTSTRAHTHISKTLFSLNRPFIFYRLLLFNGFDKQYKMKTKQNNSRNRKQNVKERKEESKKSDAGNLQSRLSCSNLDKGYWTALYAHMRGEHARTLIDTNINTLKRAHKPFAGRWNIVYWVQKPIKPAHLNIIYTLFNISTSTTNIIRASRHTKMTREKKNIYMRIVLNNTITGKEKKRERKKHAETVWGERLTQW